MNTDLLTRLYPASEIFVVHAEFDDEVPAIAVNCLVPEGRQYTARPIPYVSAEQYVRCLSQASYLFAEHILERGLVPVQADVAEFRRVIEEFEHIYYRSLAMVFHQRVPKGQAFTMRLVLKNFRELTRMDDFILFTFTNTRTVISGEMSFVFKK